jgi:hypothetical protein
MPTALSGMEKLSDHIRAGTGRFLRETKKGRKAKGTEPFNTDSDPMFKFLHILLLALTFTAGAGRAEAFFACDFAPFRN